MINPKDFSPPVFRMRTWEDCERLWEERKDVPLRLSSGVRWWEIDTGIVEEREVQPGRLEDRRVRESAFEAWVVAYACHYQGGPCWHGSPAW